MQLQSLFTDYNTFESTVQASTKQPHRRRAICFSAAKRTQQLSARISKPLDLSSRTVAILWDLDNISPASLALDLVPAVEELQV